MFSALISTSIDDSRPSNSIPSPCNAASLNPRTFNTSSLNSTCGIGFFSTTPEAKAAAPDTSLLFPLSSCIPPPSNSLRPAATASTFEVTAPESILCVLCFFCCAGFPCLHLGGASSTNSRQRLKSMPFLSFLLTEPAAVAANGW
uniref:Uncharacterized protein n=1 Tax=Arundo donax TaxID=35708 RepID=A0A0A9DHA1_ARUDO